MGSERWGRREKESARWMREREGGGRRQTYLPTHIPTIATPVIITFAVCNICAMLKTYHMNAV